MVLGLYRLIDTLGGPVISLYLRRRLAAGKEDPDRFDERLGVPSQPRPEGAIVWLHAASVGEALSVLPLMREIRTRFPALTPLLTTGTVSSSKLVADRLPEGCLHQFVPVDRRVYVRRFLKHWKPGLAIWAESEFWPHLIQETHGQGIPMAVLNGRMSARSFTQWQRFPSTARRLLSSFSKVLVQSEEDRERFQALGAPSPAVAGNLKFAADPLPADQAALTRLSDTIGDRPVWLAASTWAGEEALAWETHQACRQDHAGLLTIIVPRHPARADAIAAELDAAGAKVSRRSRGEAVTAETDILLADTLGELGLFFRLAGVVFMGKSVSAEGGQNPLEPARLDCAILFGPKMTNFTEISRRMTDAGAARQIERGTLSREAAHLLSDEAARKYMQHAAKAFAEAEAEILDRLMDEMTPLLNPLSEGS